MTNRIEELEARLAEVTKSRDRMHELLHQTRRDRDCFAQGEAEWKVRAETVTAERDEWRNMFREQRNELDALKAQPKGITIDMANAPQLPPEAFDPMKDMLIEGLLEGGKEWMARAEAAEAANLVWRENSRQTFEAMVAMRNSINEYIPMPSLESDLLQGPENLVFCAAVAEAVIAFITKEKETCRSTHETVIGATTTGPHGSDANAQDVEDRAAALRFYRAGIEAAANAEFLYGPKAIRALPDPTPEEQDAIRKGGET
jgi:hypothetical protein